MLMDVRVKEPAELTGMTIRTVRHHHRLDPPPIPAVRNGRREPALAESLAG